MRTADKQASEEQSMNVPMVKFLSRWPNSPNRIVCWVQCLTENTNCCFGQSEFSATNEKRSSDYYSLFRYDYIDVLVPFCHHNFMMNEFFENFETFSFPIFIVLTSFLCSFHRKLNSHFDGFFFYNSYWFRTVWFGLNGHHQVCKFVVENCCSVGTLFYK
jgi:hypothetical protein